MNEKAKIRNIICAILSIILAGGLGFLYYTDQQQEKEQDASVEALKAEAKEYENELQELRSELGSLESGIFYSSEEAEIMVGFNISDASDISYIEEKTEEFGFSPVLIIDCTMDMTDIEGIIEAAEETWEIMLYAAQFSEETNDDIMSVISYLDSIERKHTGVFLLRDGYESDANIELLIEDGFIGYTRYHNDTPVAGQAENGAVYFDYSYLTTSEISMSERLSAFYSNRTSLIIVFDMPSINAGSLSKSYVTSLLNTMQGYANQEDCSFSTVADVVEELSGINELEVENQEEYEEQAAEIQERIDELEETISDIYDRLEED